MKLQCISHNFWSTSQYNYLIIFNIILKALLMDFFRQIRNEKFQIRNEKFQIRKLEFQTRSLYNNIRIQIRNEKFQIRNFSFLI